jgi:hypothetical protein
MNSTASPKKKMSTGKKVLIGVGAFILLGVIANVGKDKDASSPKVASASTSTTEAAKPVKSEIGVGQTLKTEYFEITVTKVSTTNKLNTGNEFTDVSAGEGNKFLVLNTTFKNIDDESRMLIDGEIQINYNGKDYKFDKSETIMAEGWGLMLDQLNPLTTKTTKLVYKLPNEVKGVAYYHPGRSDSDDKILLGTIE